MPQSGQLWSTAFQIGKEVTAGTAVAATRIAYFNVDGTLTRTRAPRVHRFAVGRRDNVLAVTNGPIEATGSVGLPMSAEEAIELFLIGICGGVTPTTPTGATTGRQWVFKPGNLDSATLEWDDGAHVWKMPGARANEITIQGAVADTNMITASLFGTDVQTASLTGALSSRVPTFLEGWQTNVYIDALGTAPGKTQRVGLLRNWQVQLQNNLGRVYTAGNTLSANRIPSGNLDVTASFTFDANTAQTVTEFNNWDAATPRVVRLEFLGPNGEIEAAINEVQTLTKGGTWSAGTYTLTVLGQTTGAIAYDAIAATIQTAINAALASAYGSTYTAAVTGGPLSTTPVVVTFSGTGVAGRNVPIITADIALVTGSAPTVAVVETTPGYSGGHSVTVDIPGAWTTTNIGGSNDQIRTYEFTYQGIYDPTSLAAMLAVTCQNNRATAF